MASDAALRKLIAQWKDESTRAGNMRDWSAAQQRMFQSTVRACANDLESLLATTEPASSKHERLGRWLADNMGPVCTALAHPAFARLHESLKAEDDIFLAATPGPECFTCPSCGEQMRCTPEPEQAARGRLGRWLTANHRRCWKSHGNDGDGYQVWLYKNAHRESAWNGSGPTLPEAIDDALDAAERSGT